MIDGKTIVKKLKSFPQTIGASYLKFMDNGTLLAATLDSKLLVLSATYIKSEIELDGLVTSISTSMDFIAVSTIKQIYLIDAKTEKVTRLPKGNAATTMTFLKSSLLVTTTMNEIWIYDLETREIKAISCPGWLKTRREIISGASLMGQDKIFIHGSSYSCLVDLNEIAKNETKRDREGLKKKKEKGFNKIEKWTSVVAIAALEEDEVVVVERPLLKIMEALPEGYYRSRYGNN